jgi:ferric-dicitrate binding protein FerR (iron transport regulator)
LRPARPLALAASVVVALLAVGLFIGRGAGPAGAGTLATVESVSGGSVTLQPAGWLSRWSRGAEALRAGVALHRDELVETGPESVAMLRVGPGLTLRVAPGSRLRFESADRLALTRGQVYVDAGAGAVAAAGLRVATPYGDVEHVGTRYLARLEGSALEVAVREGRVRVSSPGSASGAAEAAAGEALRVTGPSAAVERRAIEPYGPAWAWLDAIPSALAIEGATLAQFLEWYAAETGREIEFADPAQRERAARIRLRGDVAGLAPDRALDAVAATVELAVARDAAVGRVRVALP